jgi:hypothetical protein
MSETNQLALKLEVLRSVEVEGLPIEMGVLQDGTPFLSGRGLAKACGISNSTLVEWGEFTPKLGDSLRAGKMAEILAAQKYEGDRFFVRVPNGIQFGKEATVSAYPDAVCMAFIEYYAFEADKERAKNSFRVLGRRELRKFIYEAIGYDPNQSTLTSWQQFHDRLLLNKVPSGYFSVFQETSGVVLNAIRSGLICDQHTVPDTSIGSVWGKYWTSNKLEEKYGSRVRYSHIYPSYFPQSQANGYIKPFIYPYAALGEFRQWLDDEYIPEKFPSYLNRKIKEGALTSESAMKVIKAITPHLLSSGRKTA